MKTIEYMQDKIIQKCGMEHPLVIWFCFLCEQYENTTYNRACLYDVFLALEDAIDYQMDME